MVSQLRNFRKLISQLRNFRSAWCDCLQMAITSSFQLRFAHCLKRWTPDFPRFKTIYSVYKMDSRKFSKCVLQLLSSWISSCLIPLFVFPPCILDLLLAKDYKAPKLGFFMQMSFHLLCHGLYKDLPHLRLLWWSKSYKKTPKLNTIWLETIARVLNIPIELKGNNYYSKVFKRVNYQL